MRNGRTILLLVATWAGAVACAAGTTSEDPGSHDAAPVSSDSGTKKNPTKDAGQAHPDASPTVDAGAADDAQVVIDAGPAQLVYGHSADTLYTFDPQSLVVTKTAPFQNCAQGTVQIQEVIDIAIDGAGDAYVTTFDGFYSLDLPTATCTLIAAGGYPNSLSFVPKGTLDPNAEALVGYNGSTYVRIDTTSGVVTTVGTLTNGYASSGDVVSVIGGGTFLTVTGNGCADCLLQVDPTTGAMIQNYGPLNHGAVYGLGFWGGVLYGFDGAGNLFAIQGASDGDGGYVATTTDIITSGGVMWWGAGSTTVAPLDNGDGGSMPLK